MPASKVIVKSQNLAKPNNYCMKCKINSCLSSTFIIMKMLYSKTADLRNSPTYFE